MSEPGTKESLWGPEGATPAPRAPGLLEQIAGVFTEPVALFRRLEATPTWTGALVLLSALNLGVVVLWARKVDVDGMLRPVLEHNPRISPESYDSVIAMQGRLLLPFGVLGACVGVTLVCLFTAWLYWLVGKVTAENRPPGFPQALSATAVAGLVTVPKVVLLIIICALKNIGSARIETLSPTAPGFYLTVESPKLQALLHALDLFSLASILLIFLAARHTLRLKVSGAALCAVITAVLYLGMPVLFTR